MRLQVSSNFSQFDSQWKDKLIGFNTDPKYNFHDFGCLQCQLGNCAVYYGKDETPAGINDKLIGVAGFVPDTGLYVHGSITKIYPDITERVVQTPDRLTDAQMQEIQLALDDGHFVIFQIDYNPKTIARDDHFVGVIGYNPKDENDFLILDSLGGSTKSLKAYLGYFKPDARKTIEEYFIYSGTPALPPIVDEPAEKPVEAPAEPAAPAVEQPKVETGGTYLPSNYDDIVHGSTQWDQIVSYLELGKTPKDAQFEDAKRVIAGLKSAKTDYSNKKIDTDKKVASLEVELTNKDKEIGRLEGEVASIEKLKNAEINTLKNNTPNFDSYRKIAEGIISGVKGDLKTAVDEAKNLRIELSHEKINSGADPLDSDTDVTTKSGLFGSLIGLIKRFIVIKL
jgi:hypothetical protein